MKLVHLILSFSATTLALPVLPKIDEVKLFDRKLFKYIGGVRLNGPDNKALISGNQLFSDGASDVRQLFNEAPSPKNDVKCIGKCLIDMGAATGQLIGVPVAMAVGAGKSVAQIGSKLSGKTADALGQRMRETDGGAAEVVGRVVGGAAGAAGTVIAAAGAPVIPAAAALLNINRLLHSTTGAVVAAAKIVPDFVNIWYSKLGQLIRESSPEYKATHGIPQELTDSQS